MKRARWGRLRAYYNGTDDRYPWVVDYVPETIPIESYELRTLVSSISLVWRFIPSVERPRSPPYNHTREDSALMPCETCKELARKLHDCPPRAFVEGFGELWIDDAGNGVIRPLGSVVHG